MIARPMMAMAGFFIFALSPSFIDVQQEAREGDGAKLWQIAAYYAMATALVWFGLFDRKAA